MNFKPVTTAVATLGLLTLIEGCMLPAKSNKMGEAALAESELPAAPRKPITYFDKDALQSGTGSVDDDADLEFLETNSGLKYRVLRKSDGRKPRASNTVTVNYRGWLDSGKEFDSSYKRGEPISFPLNGVIPGWTEGMQLIGEGGMIELWIPSNLGYGAAGSPGSVPPNATLHFIVELIKVK